MGPAASFDHGVLAREAEARWRASHRGRSVLIGYLHRGVGNPENRHLSAVRALRGPQMDYVAAVSNGLGYCEAIEKFSIVVAPPAQLR